MGQAKKRGSREERVAQAKQLIHELTPKEIKCNECGALTFDIKALDIKRLPGVTGVYVGKCNYCNSQTTAMTGEPQNVFNMMNMMAKGMGLSEESLRIQKNIRQLSNK
jgi:Zn finger protein HypA/HybF involved in hydrogenase expression